MTNISAGGSASIPLTAQVLSGALSLNWTITASGNPLFASNLEPHGWSVPASLTSATYAAGAPPTISPTNTVVTVYAPSNALALNYTVTLIVEATTGGNPPNGTVALYYGYFTMDTLSGGPSPGGPGSPPCAS